MHSKNRVIQLGIIWIFFVGICLAESDQQLTNRDRFLSPLPVSTLNPNRVEKKINELPPTGHLPPGKRRIGIALDNPIDFIKAASLVDERNGMKIYELKIVSRGAEALLLEFSSVRLPRGSVLNIYNADKTINAGPHDHRLNGHEKYNFQLIPGNTAIAQVKIPQHAVQQTSLIIERIGHCFKKPSRFYQNSNKVTQTDNCTHDNLTSHQSWMTPGRSVVKLDLLHVTEQGAVYESNGTGVLLSDKKDYDAIGKNCGDSDPDNIYMLTACHVIDVNHDGKITDLDHQALATGIAIHYNFLWIGTNHTISVGASLLLYSLWSRTDELACKYGDYYDWALLRLQNKNYILKNAKPTFAGLDFLPRPRQAGPIVNIHHPGHHVKMYNYAPASFTVRPCKDIFAVWSSGQHSQSGSSGSPFFDYNTRRVVGILSYGYSWTSDCSDHGYARSVSQMWINKLINLLDNPANPASSGNIKGFTTTPITTPDFKTYRGGEHQFVTTDTIRIGLQTRFDHVDAEFRAHSIMYNQPFNPGAAAADLSFMYDSNVLIHTNHFNIPGMTIGNPYSHMDDNTSVYIHACEYDQPIKDLELYSADETRIQTQTKVQIGYPAADQTEQVIRYRPWSKLTIEAPAIEINQTIGGTYFLPQQQHEFGGYLRFVSPNGTINGNIGQDLFAVDFEINNAVSAATAEAFYAGITYLIRPTASLEMITSDEMAVQNTSINIEAELPDQPIAAIEDESIDLIVQTPQFDGSNVVMQKLNLRASAMEMDASNLEIFIPKRHSQFPIQPYHSVIDNQNPKQSNRSAQTLMKFRPDPINSLCDNSIDQQGYHFILSANSLDLSGASLKATNNKNMILQAGHMTIKQGSELNTNGVLKNGSITLRAAKPQAVQLYSQNLKRNIENQILKYAGKTPKQTRYADHQQQEDVDHPTPEDEESTTQTGKKSCPQIPQSFSFIAYPNPFNPVTQLSFDLPNPGRVRIRIFDTLGRHIDDLVNSAFKAGSHRIEWNGANKPSAMYLAVIDVKSINGNAYRKTCKMMLLK